MTRVDLLKEYDLYLRDWDQLPSYLETISKPVVSWEEFENQHGCDCNKYATLTWAEVHGIMAGYESRIYTIRQKSFSNGRRYYVLSCTLCGRSMTSQLPYELAEKYPDDIIPDAEWPQPIRSRKELFQLYEKYRSRPWDVYQDYIGSELWAIRAMRIRERDRDLCQCCGDHGNDVHHRTYERVFKEDKDDLVLLCRRCHTVVHSHLPIIEIPARSSEYVARAIERNQTWKT